MKKLNKHGFTLAELLIVVAVIAVLVAVAIPTFANQLEKSRQGVDVSNLRGAFAAARIAQMDQAVNSEDITDTNNVFWYDPDSGELKKPANATSEAASAFYGTTASKHGKATSAKLVADTSGLNAKVVYTASTLPTNEKAILVAFTKNPTSGVYEIADISYQSYAVPVATLTFNTTTPDLINSITPSVTVPTITPTPAASNTTDNSIVYSVTDETYAKITTETSPIIGWATMSSAKNTAGTPVTVIATEIVTATKVPVKRYIGTFTVKVNIT